ncbi:tol-pal system-associated acyl-CoA thioesterase [Inquilinus limosus]|uniref:tol-pal system-associated acyl-CoA thioesterase n=1 Tax=Inquilinus limosus TaxID=171674 RepID=UPI003F14ED51
MTAPHLFSVRVYWEDTDGSGIVYHASYLRFAERARTELLRTAGFEQWSMLAETGIAFAVRHCAIDYRRSARLDDQLTVETRVTAIGGASLEMSQAIRRGDDEIVTILLKLACITRDGRAARMPPRLREVFNAIKGQTASHAA